ncbi:MAG: hypothetical protein ACOCVA_04915 [Prolixibacteraceae bacterium]
MYITVFAASDSSLLIAGESDSKFILYKTDHDLNITWKRTDFEWGNIVYGDGWGSVYNYPKYVKIFQRTDGKYTCLCSMRYGGDIVLFSVKLIQFSPNGKVLLDEKFQNHHITM